MRTIEADTPTGERRLNLKDSDDRKAIPNTSGQLPKGDITGTTPNLGEGATPDHIEIIVDLEAEAEASPLHKRIEAPTLALAPEIEKNQQKDQNLIYLRRLKPWRKKLEQLKQVIKT